MEDIKKNLYKKNCGFLMTFIISYGEYITDIMN